MMSFLLTILTASQITFINGLSVRYDEIPDGMVATPHGIRPKQCVHAVKDNNHIIKPLSGGVLVEYPGLNTTEWFPEQTECVENAKKLQIELQERAEGNYYKVQNGGWAIYAMYTTPSDMGNFSATYTLPDESPTDDGQILYYFIGIGTKQEHGGIIQPCIGYCPGNGGCGQAYGNYKGWSMSSWNCCPSGMTHYGKGVKLEAGVTVKAYCYSTGKEVKIWEEWNGQVSQLVVKNDTGDFVNLAVSGEFYNYKGCQDFNKKPFMFKNMKLTDLKGDNVSPKWEKYDKIPNCGASIKFDGNTATLIGAS